MAKIVAWDEFTPTECQQQVERWRRSHCLSS